MFMYCHSEWWTIIKLKYLKPKAVVSQQDKSLLLTALQDYLNAMRKMTFEQDRKHDKRLEVENVELFYQIF